MFYLLFIILFSSCSTNNPSSCVSGEDCYQKALSNFNTIEKVKSKSEGELIKTKSADYFDQGCSMNHALSCYELAKYYRFKGQALKASSYFEKACQLSQQKSCELLQ